MGYDEHEDDDSRESTGVLTETRRDLATARDLPPDLMLLKMENESIMSVAAARPRNIPAILKQLRELIDAYPEAADEAIYVKPVGTETQVICGECGKSFAVPYIGRDGVECGHCRAHNGKNAKQRKVKKFAEGLSIRAAESIRSIYGFNRLAISMEDLEDGKVKIAGVFVDYSTGTMTADARIVSPWYTTWDKKTARHPEDRFLSVLVKAEKSKLRRDLILDSVPSTLKAAFRDACEKKLAALITPEVISAQILPYFTSLGIGAEHLEAIVGRPMSMGWTEQDRGKLKQVATAIKNGETTVEAILDGLVNEDAAEQPKTAADLGSQLKGKKEPPKKPAPPTDPPAPWDAEHATTRFEACQTESECTTLADELIRLYEHESQTIGALEGVRKEQIQNATKAKPKGKGGQLPLGG